MVNHDKYSTFGEVFDIGNSTRQALYRYSQGTAPLKCGAYKDYDNGNGSLMRILPVLFYLQTNFGKDFQNHRQAFEIIHNISPLTLGHKRSHIACGIYISVALRLNIDDKLECAVSQGIKKARDFYRQDITYQNELSHFQRLEKSDFKDLDEAEINSGGYVVNTLEATLWCLLNTDNYQSCVLKAVNLKEDTDTTAAVVGGLAGLKYGDSDICKKWLQVLAKKAYIENLSNQLYKSINTNISK